MVFQSLRQHRVRVIATVPYLSNLVQNIIGTIDYGLRNSESWMEMGISYNGHCRWDTGCDFVLY